MGRQPWLVFGEVLTRDGVSRSVSLAEVLTSFTAHFQDQQDLKPVEATLFGNGVAPLRYQIRK